PRETAGRIHVADVVALILQGANAPRIALGDPDFLVGQQTHELGAGVPVLEYQIAVLAHRIPDGVHVLNVVRVLVGLQRRVPDAGLPFGPAAELALVLVVDQDAGALFLHLLIADVLAVVGDSG